MLDISEASIIALLFIYFYSFTTLTKILQIIIEDSADEYNESLSNGGKAGVTCYEYPDTKNKWPSD